MQVCANITGGVELEISVSASLEVVQAEDQGSYIVHALVLGLLAPLREKWDRELLWQSLIMHMAQRKN